MELKSAYYSTLVPSLVYVVFDYCDYLLRSYMYMYEMMKGSFFWQHDLERTYNIYSDKCSSLLKED